MNDDYVHVDQAMEYVWDHGLIELDDIIAWIDLIGDSETALEAIKSKVDGLLEERRQKLEDANLVTPEEKMKR